MIACRGRLVGTRAQCNTGATLFSEGPGPRVNACSVASSWRWSLGDGDAAGRAVDGEHGPAVAVLAAELDQQHVLVVLDAQPVGRVAVLAQRAWWSSLGLATNEVQRERRGISGGRRGSRRAAGSPGVPA